MNPESYYRSAVSEGLERLNGIRGQAATVSFLRLLIFIGLAAELWALSRGYSVGGLVIAVGLAGAFIGSVNWYFRLKDQRLLWEKLVFVNENEQGVLAGRTNQFPDGKAFLDGLGYGDDLDVYGPQSLFHTLNRTTTLHGTEVLAEWLGKSCASPDAIRAQQEAVRVLAGQAGLRQLLTAKGLLAGDHPGDLHTMSDWLNAKPRLLGRVWLRVLMGLVTVVNIALLLYAFSGGPYWPLLLTIAAGWAIKSFFSKYIQQQHQQVEHKQAAFMQYADILAVFCGVETGGSATLEKLRSTALEAHTAIRQLSKLVSFFDQRLNMLVNLLLNSLAFYDLQCMVALERWKGRYAPVFPEWTAAVGDIEGLNSLAMFAFNNPEYIYPVAVEPGPLLIETAQLAHPLIPAARRVANDFRIGVEEKLILVTGSNMSGKTTFLRTIGVNLLLAQCGAPVCATAFSFTPVQILTSLRISDSLQEQTSYFMAELKKLQQIVSRLESGAPTLVLIDEILRGTNSEDKTYGSERFARKLVKYRCLSLFATHDLALGALETELPGVVANYCFESVIENGDLYFNYRLQRGMARNRNASFLMNKMGII
jgi:hypothetical protein